MAATVIAALRRFLPAFLREDRPLTNAQRRALWAIQHCRTAELGGHLLACEPCGTRAFRFHSCNHRACPQCGRQATAQWVSRQLDQRVGAPYFMVTFTLPAQLRKLFFTPAAKEVHGVFFAAAAAALKESLAHRRSLRAATTGFTLVLHTWNQRLHFHPHLHAIVPGTGIDAADRVVTVNRPTFLAPKAVLRAAFRRHFKAGLDRLAKEVQLPAMDRRLWQRDWGVQLQSFGDGQNAIKYLGAYVCRTAIGDSRIRQLTASHVTFSWKDRQAGGIQKTETVSGVEFVARYLRHVLPRGLKATRHYGFCRPAARVTRERLAFHTGRPLLAGSSQSATQTDPAPGPLCPCCHQPMKPVLQFLPAWKKIRGPPLHLLARQAA